MTGTTFRGRIQRALADGVPISIDSGARGRLEAKRREPHAGLPRFDKRRVVTPFGLAGSRGLDTVEHQE